MSVFGFKINEARVIDYDKTDKRILNYLLENEPSFNLCIFCGSCTATCSAGNFTDFNIRKLKMFIRRGLVSEIATEAEKCMLCGKCFLVCPRGVNNRNIILKVRDALTKIENHEI
ncbi:MAG: (4Fe-4S)-binding protein [Bacteroidetes bacterium GWC2_33_15]|nr:MAG: (4Fe-4S)-binding protein [Bacteroidetes bacterium GWA2_33_15]OFX49852.1 MAG: (4Fe-4S)-binding protein [Bacteroidetes bacterium GWC2_33_15]OFX65043.1 MAG: (4Fe-4S)-binding protein [Bacteroidetes bacterium GWB2_32_14]OFX68995.1 MAG: (4Fe-4S)-binding protein [Bacteroidetes bacterium GWD2_33_33]HAN18260.1 (4Fe-4S)-binding protein [Bacteroidales bacterium]